MRHLINATITRYSKPLVLAAQIILLLNCGTLQSQETISPDKNWAQSDSIDFYWSIEKLEEVKQHADSIGTASLFIVQNGKVILDWGKTSKNLHIFSVRKSLLSALYGIYSNKGIIDLSSTLADLEIDDLPPELTSLEKSARIRDLLKSRSGVYHKAAYETPGMEKNRPKRGTYKPGEHWFYNNWDFNALTTIFEKLVSVSVFEAFEEQIAKPLMMEDFDIGKLQYHYEDQSIHPATIYYLSARDLARFGLLYLRNGMWKDKQLISKKWIEESTSAFSDLGILGGYGYCWWVSLKGEHYPFIRMPDGTFSARGTGEQTLLVIPAYDLVIVHQTEVNSPDDDIMHVVEFARLLQKILNSRKD